MSNKVKEILKLIRSNPYTPKKQQQILRTYCNSLLTISIIFIVSILMELVLKDYKIIKYSIGLAVIFIVLYFVTKKFKILQATRIVTALILTYCYTMTFWIGTGHGCGSSWMLLMPSLTMYLLGYRIGVYISVYFWLLTGSCCFIPAVRAAMRYQYSDRYLTILFIILTVDIIFSFITMFAYYRNQLKQKALEEKLEKSVLKEHMRVTNISIKTILAISNAVEAKDEYTSEHSHRVADFSCAIARKLGWSEQQVEQLRNIALLHDIGKISVAENILNKPGKLTDDEFNQIKRHTIVGGEILNDLTLIPNVALGAKYHHERFDSRGYPSGLKGKDIPIEARIICIADSFDAMRYKRVYRGECDPEYIRGELIKGRGSQFDPDLLDVFLQIVDEEKLL